MRLHLARKRRCDSYSSPAQHTQGPNSSNSNSFRVVIRLYSRAGGGSDLPCAAGSPGSHSHDRQGLNQGLRRFAFYIGGLPGCRPRFWSASTTTITTAIPWAAATSGSALSPRFNLKARRKWSMRSKRTYWTMPSISSAWAPASRGSFTLWARLDRCGALTA